MGSTEANVKAYMRDLPIRKAIREEYSHEIDQKNQIKHIKGTPEYAKEQKKYRDIEQHGPSYMSLSTEEIKRLYEKYAGTGVLRYKNGRWMSDEFITTHPDVIGVTVDNITGEELETTVFRI